MNKDDIETEADVETKQKLATGISKSPAPSSPVPVKPQEDIAGKSADKTPVTSPADQTIDQASVPTGESAQGSVSTGRIDAKEGTSIQKPTQNLPQLIY